MEEEEGSGVKRPQNERAERWGEGHKRGWMAGGGRGGRRSGPEINSNRRWAKSHQQQVNLGKKSRRRWRRWRLKSSLRKPARPCHAAPSTWGDISITSSRWTEETLRETSDVRTSKRDIK